MSNNSIHDRINKRGTIDKWARYTINDWQKELRRLKIGSSGQAYASFKYNVTFKGDTLISIRFEHKFYLRFVEMGVGKGVDAFEVAELKIERRLIGRKAVSPRRPKKWRTTKLAYNRYRLAEILQESFGQELTKQMVQIIHS